MCHRPVLHIDIPWESWERFQPVTCHGAACEEQIDKDASWGIASRALVGDDRAAVVIRPVVVVAVVAKLIHASSLGRFVSSKSIEGVSH